MTLDTLAQSFGQICLEAAIPVMDVYDSDFTAEQKADKSPVTEADKRAEVIILDALAKLMPDVPVLAEESFEAGIRPSVQDEFLLVDPSTGAPVALNRAVAERAARDGVELQLELTSCQVETASSVVENTSDLRDELLSDWIRERPGTRPYAW